MDPYTKILVKNFICYSVIPVFLGIAVMAAIVLNRSGRELSTTRLLVGCSMQIIIPVGVGVIGLYTKKRRNR